MMTIQPDSLVTLNLRICQADGAVMYSSFEATPLTHQLGNDELAPALEAKLIGLQAGTQTRFDFAPGEVFGDYQEALIERVARQHIPADLDLVEDGVFSFTAPDGSRYPGLVRQLTNDFALVDFNHPLAGKAVSIDVAIIGIV